MCALRGIKVCSAVQRLRLELTGRLLMSLPSLDEEAEGLGAPASPELLPGAQNWSRLKPDTDFLTLTDEAAGLADDADEGGAALSAAIFCQCSLSESRVFR